MPEHSWTSKASVSQLDLAREQVGAGEVRELTDTQGPGGHGEDVILTPNEWQSQGVLSRGGCESTQGSLKGARAESRGLPGPRWGTLATGSGRKQWAWLEAF